MTTQWKIVLLVALVAAVAFGAGAALVGGRHRDAPSTPNVSHGETITEWTCSMHPQIRNPEPGLCPLCAMDLIPVTGDMDEAAGPGQISLSERAMALARIRTTEVTRRDESAVDVRLLGRVEADESTLKTVTAWMAGRIDRLHIKVTGEQVAAGRAIATLYSPEVYAAHQDLLVAQKQRAALKGGTPSAKLAAKAALDAARERLMLLGVPEKEVRRMGRAKRPTRQVKIRSPFAGTIIERLATEGSYVTTGDPLYRIANLSRLWIQLDAYENDLRALEVGQQVLVEVEAFSGEVFEGKVAFIDPTVHPQTRTARVRVEVDNEERLLRPGMFAQALVKGRPSGRATAPLLVPRTAALFTGRRSIVYVEVPHKKKPTYELREVRLGPLMGDSYPVVSGLSAGERVVTRGAFVVDADLQIRGGNSMMARPDDTELKDELVVLTSKEAAVLAPLVNRYLDLARELAATDLEASRTQTAAFLEALGKVGFSKSSTARESFDAIAATFQAHGSAVVKAPSVEEARKSFEPLSDTMGLFLMRFGNPTDAPIRHAYCPMAMGSKGAGWFQRSDVVDNAYFGDLMRTCGEIKATLEPGAYLAPRPEAAP